MKRPDASKQKSRTDEASVNRWEAIALQDLPYHMKQFEEPYRSTVALAQFIRSVAPDIGGVALDVGCGAGALIHYFHRQFPGLRWTGVDIAGKVLFPKSQHYFERDGPDVRFLSGDFARLRNVVEGATFDLVICTQVISYVPKYEPLLKQLMSVTRGWLFLSGLFTDFRVDANIALTDYTWPEAISGPYHYNVYGLPRFREQCKKLGAAKIESAPFVIDIDLQVPSHGGLGTYTRREEGGARLQFSGPIHLPWQFVAVHAALHKD
jgi:2-polyprenyl-3-methyl-5-hydroxy-6-metoxy-1,4-benzoquinol methylase